MEIGSNHELWQALFTSTEAGNVPEWDSDLLCACRVHHLFSETLTDAELPGAWHELLEKLSDAACLLVYGADDDPFLDIECYERDRIVLWVLCERDRSWSSRLLDHALAFVADVKLYEAMFLQQGEGHDRP